MTVAMLVDGVRTPVGRFGGALADVRADDLAALVVRSVVDRSGLPADAIDDVILGSANQGGEDNRNVARMAALLAGLPDRVPGYTVNRLCASGLQAVASAGQAIVAGQASAVVAGGVESMTRAPWVLPKQGPPWPKAGSLPSDVEGAADTALGWRLVNPLMRALDGGDATLSLGECTEKLARLRGVSREEADAFAVASQSRAAQAWAAGDFEAEIVAVPTPAGSVTVDETVRAGTTLEGLAGLRASFREDGVVTAGNASPLTDGASAMVVASEEAVERNGLRARARIVDYVVAGVAPSLFGLGPVPAITGILERNGLAMADIDAVEINEAFAAQVLACQRDLRIDPERLNPVGGAIALGHPLGSSGCRLLVTLLGHLERTGGRRGIAALCIGVGQGAAMLVERV